MSQPIGKIVILDFKTSEVHVFPYDHNTHEAEELVNELHENGEIESSGSNCHWMTVDELNIKIH